MGVRWQPPRLEAVPSLRPVLDSLRDWLDKPKFPRGFDVGNGANPTYDAVNNVTVDPPLVAVTSDNLVLRDSNGHVTKSGGGGYVYVDGGSHTTADVFLTQESGTVAVAANFDGNITVGSRRAMPSWSVDCGAFWPATTWAGVAVRADVKRQSSTEVVVHITNGATAQNFTWHVGRIGG